MKVPKKNGEFEKFAVWAAKLGVIIATISVVLFIWGRLDSFNYQDPIDSALFDHFGSFISGVVGSIWTLASVVLFYLTLKEQRLEKRTDRVEASCFQLVEIYHQGLSSIKLTETSTTTGKPPITKEYIGRSIFFYYHNFLLDIRNHNIKNFNLPESYNKMYFEEPHNLSYTLRMITHIVKFIDSASISVTHKKRYVEIASIQLSDYERIFLYFNVLYIPEFAKFHSILDKYGIFDNLRNDLLI